MKATRYISHRVVDKATKVARQKPVLVVVRRRKGKRRVGWDKVTETAA